MLLKLPARCNAQVVPHPLVLPGKFAMGGVEIRVLNKPGVPRQPGNALDPGRKTDMLLRSGTTAANADPN